MNLRTLVLGLILTALAAGPAQADGLPKPDALPLDGEVLHGEATFDESANSLTVAQQSDRAVLRWDSFDIGKDAGVHFAQPGSGAAALNIVDATTSSILAGKLSADGSVFLINPRGITVTPDGKINTGGAFVASTLGAVNEAEFMNGSSTLTFSVPEGDEAGPVLNEGDITARDVLLLGSRVGNSGTITARLGRVALGSALEATLDLTGDGFLQVLAPAEIDETDTDPLITNRGAIVADGGLVQLKAASVHQAIREAVHMPGEVRARSVAGRDGAIVFGGEGGAVVITGTVDATRDEDKGGTQGGAVDMAARSIHFDPDDLKLSPGGRIALTADYVVVDDDVSWDPIGASETWYEGRLFSTTVNVHRDVVGHWLRTGVDVALQANHELGWSADLKIVGGELAPEAAGRAGNLHLLAGARLSLDGEFSTHNGNWRLSANAKPAFGDGPDVGSATILANGSEGSPTFLNSGDYRTGRVIFEILGGEDSAGLKANDIELPRNFAGEALTARISREAPGYDSSYIAIRGNAVVTDTITLGGNIFLPGDGDEGSSSTRELSGRTVQWVTETTDRLYGGGGQLKFIENGIVTRFGRGNVAGSGDTEADATRLVLGGSSVFTRLYGDADPDQSGLGELLLTFAPHNRIVPGQGSMDGQQQPLIGIPEGGIPLREILAPGSIGVTGPGLRAEISSVSGVDYYLSLRATDSLAFKPLTTEERFDGNCCYMPSYVGGAAGGFWIDLSGNASGNQIPLTIAPRPLTAELFNPVGSSGSYEYGSPEALFRLHGIVPGDDLRPVISLNGARTTVNPLTGGRFGLDPRTKVDSYVYAVTGIDGERVRNYVFDPSALPEGSVVITPRTLTVRMEADLRQQTYGSVVDPITVSNALSDDDVAVDVRLFNGQGAESEFDRRLDAGEYTLSVGGLKGLDARNYEYSLIGFNVSDGTARLTVDPKLLTWSVSNTTTTYGDGAAPTLTLDGVVEDDDVFLDTEWLRLAGSSGSVISTGGHRAAGEYTLLVDGISGEAKHNYTINKIGMTDDKWTVMRKLLHMPVVGSVAYGDRFEFLAPERDGALSGDDIRIAVEVDGHPYHPLGPFLDPGKYDSRFVGIVGEDAGNYALWNPGASGDVSLTITKRPVTIHVLDGTRTYGDDPITMLSHVRIDNLLPGDVGSVRDFRFSVVTDPAVRAPLYELTPAGSHLVQVTTLNHPKYELAADGHTAGRIVIEPKPIRYTTPNWEVEYGRADPYLGMAILNEADIVSGDNVLPGTVVVADREMYPERLQTNNKYPLALGDLTGSAKDNYVIEHVGSTQGLLTVLPKRIQHSGLVLDYNGTGLDWRIGKFGDLETLHGFAEDEDGGFSINLGLSGVLPGDDVSTDLLRPRLEYSSQGYLAVGEYTWTLQGLSGSDSHNYVLADGSVSRSLEIQPRPVRLYAEKTGLEYGHSVPNVDLRFDGDDDKFFAGAALDVTNIVFRGRDGRELTWDDLWNGPPVRLPAGVYSARILDDSKPFLVGADAKNFKPTLVGAIQISPRILRFTPPLSTSWVYGRAFSERSLYDAVIDRDRAPGVLPGDEVGFEYWTVGRGISENNLNALLNPYSLYSPAGEYSGFGFRLTGADAANYELIQPDYTVTIEPRPLELPLDTLYPGEDGSWEYVIDFTDVVRPSPGERGGVMPEDEADEAMFIGVRGDDGIVRPIHATDAGRYDMQSLALTGRWAGNYELQIPRPEVFLRINPRSLLFSIEDVDGHYGNFLACWDPRTCNGGPRGPHGDQYLWVPGLELGDVELDGVLPGHDVRVGDVILIDAAGRTGRLEDVPPPGVYFQVVDGLVGEDARNYRIADTGSRPGILAIFPQWVRWETTDGIYMPETGFRSLNPDPDYDAHPNGELLPGLQATLTGAEGDLHLDPEFQFVGLDIDLWEDTFIGNPRNLRPGNYSIEVSGFAGDAGALYQPVPGSMGFRGILSVFADSRLGLESVGSFDGELPPAGRDFAGGGGAQSSGTGASVPAAGTGSGTGSGATTMTGGGASGTNSSPGFGGQFGVGIDQELFDTAGMRGDAYAGALAEYGVTGVKLKAKAGLEVEYEIGAGYVRTGAEARAQAEVGPTGVKGTARVTAQVGGGGGGSLGGGVDGRGEANVGVFAGADGRAGLTFENGNFKMGTKAHVGAGGTVDTSGSLSWHAGSVDAKVTVYSPGSIGQNFSFGAGMSGAVLNIDLTLGGAIGFGGLELDLGFSIDLGGLRDGFESFACGSGLVSCTPSQMELGENHALTARHMADPLERFAYLHQNQQWRYIGGAIEDGRDVDPDIAQAYYENRAFFDYVEELLTDVERYISEQEAAQRQFFQDLEYNPSSALNMARNTYSEHNYFTRQAQSIHERMTALDMRLELRRENLEGLGVD